MEDKMEELLLGTIFPEVTEKARRKQKQHTRLISALTQLLLSRQTETLEILLRRSTSAAVDPLAAQIYLLEQTELCLGDMWEADLCSEADIALAVVDMIAAMRTIHLHKLPQPHSTSAELTVLVVSEPGECHLLPAVLDAEVLYQRGWHLQLDFPSSDKELVQRVGDEWFAAVDISLSNVFRREHWLQRLADTVEKIRRHSRNRQVAITVSGRLFRDHHRLPAQIGADRSVLSASEIESSLVEALKTSNGNNWCGAV
jgi:hypothetical protein